MALNDLALVTLIQAKNYLRIDAAATYTWIATDVGNCGAEAYAELYNRNLGVIEAVTADLYFDDYVTAEYAIGDVRVLRSQPNADGINRDFGTRAPTNGRPYFGLVDECPVDDADYVSNEEDAGVAKEETYG
ncbi:unnamed protein product, partial [marine sediment metagenome]